MGTSEITQSRQGPRGYRKFVQDGIDELESVKSLPAINRNGLITEMASYFSCVEKMASSKIKAGEHLLKARNLSMSEGTFKEISETFNIDLRKAYRLMGLHERLQKLLPPEGLITAPDDLGSIDPHRPFGNYQDVIDVKSLPKSKDLSVWRKFWAGKEEEMGEKWGERHKGTTKPKELVKRTLYLDFQRRLRQAPKKDQLEVFEEVVSWVMVDMGISSQKVFKPHAAPSDIKPKRGRPRKNKVALLANQPTSHVSMQRTQQIER